MSSPANMAANSPHNNNSSGSEELKFPQQTVNYLKTRGYNGKPEEYQMLVVAMKTIIPPKFGNHEVRDSEITAYKGGFFGRSYQFDLGGQKHNIPDDIVKNCLVDGNIKFQKNNSRYTIYDVDNQEYLSFEINNNQIEIAVEFIFFTAAGHGKRRISGTSPILNFRRISGTPSMPSSSPIQNLDESNERTRRETSFNSSSSISDLISKFTSGVLSPMAEGSAKTSVAAVASAQRQNPEDSRSGDGRWNNEVVLGANAQADGVTGEEEIEMSRRGSQGGGN